MQAPRTTAVLAAVLLVAGCANRESAVNKRAHSGVGTASAVGGIQQVVITTGVDLRFHPSTIVVHRGLVRIVLENVPTDGGGPPHNVVFGGLPVADVPLTEVGGTNSVTFRAPSPGTYDFVCTIHARQGQTGKMIVE